MTASFRKDQLAFNKYQTALDEIKEANLTLKKNSYEIIKWEVEVGKEFTAAYKSDAYSSVLGTHLTMGQYAGGTSAQPFKTEKIILIS
jgi:hypothetical protein